MSWILPRSALATALLVGACGGGDPPDRPTPMVPRPAAPETRSVALPPTPYVDGPLELSVVYPPEGARVAVRDSTFIFGSTGTGAASLTINGAVVPVARNGAFLAFLPVPADGVYRLDASTVAARDTLTVNVTLPPAPSFETPLLDAGSAYPRGSRVALEGERVEAGFTGRRGGSARLILPDGRSIPLSAAPGSGPLTTYRGFFDAQRLMSGDTSVAWPALTGEARPLVPRAPAVAPAIERAAVFELIVDGDTVREPLPFNLLLLEDGRPRVGVVSDPRPIEERGDRQVIARPGPGFGPYDYFWPDGTELTLTGEQNGQYRVRLTDELSVWSPADEIRLLTDDSPLPESRVESVNIRPAPGWIDVRFPISRRLPFRVDEGQDRIEIQIYGALSRTNRIDYGALDPFVRRAEWQQPNDALYRFTLHLNGWAWGHDVFHDPRGWLVLRVRRPPPIDPERPLQGRVIAVDAGHGGAAAGAQGPTGLREADAVLAVARALARRLEAAGARAVLTRNEDVDLSLEDRVARATAAGAELMLSIHMDAFPDGVNPYVNAGTHMFYFHPRAADLARHLQRALLDELALPDRGINRADLALARPTWMPSVLTETMFMMIPQWEAALRDPDVIDRIAEAHAEGIAAFLRARARD
ncbi:MAG TPA: N-acetylmuramoyl-L-alanine amidase [Longimicrobiales bacterium]|nr:N-acetylmuramoyl-L-alanine amidase [Longimicrobiales bacterium]